jgi:Protein of unknown function (DUF2800)
MPDYHAIASPSSAEKWLTCPNSLAAELGQPDNASPAADLGTDKHELLTLCLESGKSASNYIGHFMQKGNEVDAAFAADVQNVVENVRARIRNYEKLGARVEMDLEQDVPIGHITGEEGATGRADVVLRVYWKRSTNVEVIDAKFGYSEVSPETPQLKMYGAGVIEKFSLTDEFRNIGFVIEQPARQKESIEGEPIPAIVLTEWAETVASPAAHKALTIRKLAEEGQRALKTEDFTVTEKGCQWCKAAAVCPARLEHVEAVIGADFGDIADMTKDGMALVVDLLDPAELGEKFEHLEVIEDWIKAVRARIDQELLSGKKIPGLKVVAGKRGNRQWNDDAEAEAMMKKFRLKLEQMYSFKLLGPKPILEALKDQPRRLKQIEALVVQKDGKPHVALESDKRPALEIQPLEDGFEAEDDLC